MNLKLSEKDAVGEIYRTTKATLSKFAQSDFKNISSPYCSSWIEVLSSIFCYVMLPHLQYKKSSIPSIP